MTAKNDANANLIAAAQGLMETLEFCERWFEKHSPTAPLIINGIEAEHPVLTCIRAALAIAKTDGSLKMTNISQEKWEKWYFVIFSSGSRNSCAGLGRINAMLFPEKKIIEQAELNAEKRGENLFQYTKDIEWTYNEELDECVQSRDWEEGEHLAAALSELTDDGEIFEAFLVEKENAEFLSRATELGIEIKAKELLADHG